jgi:gamma-glutamyltranspeptidase/glutathione hydrolase
LVALAVADGLPGEFDWGSADYLHQLIEAMRLGLAEARAWIADPAMSRLPVGEILTDAYADRLRSRIGQSAIGPEPHSLVGAGDDTVYLATVDAEGNACSFINSNYMGFGSGLVAGDTGIALQNRGAGFVMDETHPNALEPGKRPYHTIIPGLVTRPDGSLLAAFGVMGGHMQPQGHLQVLANVLDYGMDPQRALDAPRFQITADGSLALEPWFSDAVRDDLESRGHTLIGRAETPPAGTFGGGQMILVEESGVRIGGSDPRKDGCAVAASGVVASDRAAADPAAADPAASTRAP